MRKVLFSKGDERHAHFPRPSNGQIYTEKYGDLYMKLTEILEADMEVYATLEKAAAFHASVKLPGFGVALSTPYSGKSSTKKVPIK